MPVDLVEIAPNVFSHETELSLGFGFRLNARMTIIRHEGELWIHSPLPDDGWYGAASKLGQVRWLVAPNCLHYLFMDAAAGHFKEALVAAPAALRAKRPELAIDYELEDEAPDNWPKSISSISVCGAGKIAEHLFYDSESRSLLVTDLVFNNERGVNWVTRAILAIFAPSGRVSRSLEWKFLVKDRTAFEGSLSGLSTLKLERIIPAHGRVIEDVEQAISVMRFGKSGT